MRSPNSDDVVLRRGITFKIIILEQNSLMKLPSILQCPKLRRRSLASKRSTYSVFLLTSVLSGLNVCRISEGQYYEAHQQLRVVASRYVKTSNWGAAIDILYGGALALLKAGQGGSGGDLGLYLLDVFGKGEIPVRTEEKG